MKNARLVCATMAVLVMLGEQWPSALGQAPSRNTQSVPRVVEVHRVTAWIGVWIRTYDEAGNFVEALPATSMPPLPLTLLPSDIDSTRNRIRLMILVAGRPVPRFVDQSMVKLDPTLPPASLPAPAPPGDPACATSRCATLGVIASLQPPPVKLSEIDDRREGGTLPVADRGRPALGSINSGSEPTQVAYELPPWLVPGNLPRVPAKHVGLVQASATRSEGNPETLRLDAPLVTDTASLRSGNRLIRLFAINGLPEHASEMQAFLAAQGGALDCVSTGTGSFTCTTPSGIDLAELALVNGAAVVQPDAPERYWQQQAAARAARRGVWGKQDPPSLPARAASQPTKQDRTPELYGSPGSTAREPKALPPGP